MTIPIFVLLVLLFVVFMWGFTYRERLDKYEIEQRAQELAEIKFQEWKNKY